MKAIHLLSIKPGQTLLKTENSNAFIVINSFCAPIRFIDLKSVFRSSGKVEETTLNEVISVDTDISFNLEVIALEGYEKKDLGNVSFIDIESIKIPDTLFSFFDPQEIYLGKIRNPHLRLIAPVIIEDDNKNPLYALIALVHPVFN